MSFFIQYNNKNEPIGCSEFPLTGIDFVSKEVDEDTFNKYIMQKEHKLIDEEKKQTRIDEIQNRLDKITQDFIQVLCGAVFDDIEERKQEFQTLHNELRVLLGKEPRIYE